MLGDKFVGGIFRVVPAPVFLGARGVAPLWNDSAALDEQQYRELQEAIPSGVFKAGMGAEAVFEFVKKVDLDQLARLMGLPGKLGMDGSAVWGAWQQGRIDEIRDYCETDVVNTWLVYLRFQQMRGALNAAAYQREIALVRDTLAGFAFTRISAVWSPVSLPRTRSWWMTWPE